MRNEIAPLALSIVNEFKPESLARRGGCLYVRITPGGNLSEAIAAIEAAYRKYQSKTPFEYNFLDDAFDAMYKSEDGSPRW
ncbi:MAG: hypothetical protein HC859_03835 [Bacteroidia bacterium]|nr:hypothetical protein [Bacteroidia bacterium]